MRGTVTAVLLAITLAGCGGGATGGGEDLSTPKAIAQKIGCEGYADTTTEELGVEKVGTCKVNGEDVRVLTFASTEARDTFKKTAEQFGGRYVEGENFLVEANSAEAESAVKAKL